MLSDFRRTLNDFQVSEREQRELIAIAETTGEHIVVRDDGRRRGRRGRWEPPAPVQHPASGVS